MEKDGKETLCKPLCLLIYIAENLFLSDSIQQLLQRHRFHFLDQKLVLLTKYASRLKKKKKKEEILNREGMFAFYFSYRNHENKSFPICKSQAYPMIYHK